VNEIVNQQTGVVVEHASEAASLVGIREWLGSTELLRVPERAFSSAILNRAAGQVRIVGEANGFSEGRRA